MEGARGRSEGKEGGERGRVRMVRVRREEEGLGLGGWVRRVGGRRVRVRREGKEGYG